MVAMRVEYSITNTFYIVNTCLIRIHLHIFSTCDIKRLHESGIAFNILCKLKMLNSVLLTYLSNVSTYNLCLFLYTFTKMRYFQNLNLKMYYFETDSL